MYRVNLELGFKNVIKMISKPLSIKRLLRTPSHYWHIPYSFLSWFALANRMRRDISPGSSFATWVVHAVTAPSWSFCLRVAFIVHLIAGRKLSKCSIKTAYYSWKPRPRKPTSHMNRHHGTNVFTTEGYTVTSPTVYEPPQESELEYLSSYHRLDSEADNDGV